MHTDDVRQQIEDAPTVLVLGGPYEEGTKEACTALLSRTPPAETVVVKVSDAQSVSTPIKTWTEHTEAAPRRMVVLSVAEQAGEADPADLPEYVEVETANPGDLTGLGIKLQRHLGDVQRANPDCEVTVCFDALSTLLMYADTNVVYRFVRVVTQYFLAANATVHFHIDPAAHDDRTIQVFKTVVDTLVEVEPDGTYDVVSR